jgi:hypothetical protein
MADCEWNPAENRPAYEDDPPHGEATWTVGVDGKWHLCEACAQSETFKRYRVRRPLTEALAQAQAGRKVRQAGEPNRGTGQAPVTTQGAARTVWMIRAACNGVTGMDARRNHGVAERSTASETAD